jgi:hypothetical protein
MALVIVVSKFQVFVHLEFSEPKPLRRAAEQPSRRSQRSRERAVLDVLDVSLPRTVPNAP